MQISTVNITRVVTLIYFFSLTMLLQLLFKNNTINHTGKLIEWRALIKVYMHAVY